MSQSIEECDDKMIELEQEVVIHRAEDMDDEDNCSVDEFLEMF